MKINQSFTAFVPAQSFDILDIGAGISCFKSPIHDSDGYLTLSPGTEKPRSTLKKQQLVNQNDFQISSKF